MPEQIFEIEPIRKRALQVLRQHGDYLPVGTIAVQLGVPLYAADCALETAYLAREVEFVAGLGWRIAPSVTAPVAIDERQQAIGGARS